MWPQRVPAFSEKYPNVKVEPDLHAGDIQEKQAALIASGEIGDVVHTHFSAAQPQRLYLGRSMRELDTLIGKDKLDLKQWYPQAIDAGRLDGKVIALPFKGKMATVALFYNQTLFEQGGVKPPDAEHHAQRAGRGRRQADPAGRQPVGHGGLHAGQRPQRDRRHPALERRAVQQGPDQGHPGHPGGPRRVRLVLRRPAPPEVHDRHRTTRSSSARARRR